MTDAELAQCEAGRDLAADWLQAVCEMKAKKLYVVLSPVTWILLSTHWDQSVQERQCRLPNAALKLGASFEEKRAALFDLSGYPG
jgi:hypothetical protein